MCVCWAMRVLAVGGGSAAAAGCCWSLGLVMVCLCGCVGGVVWWSGAPVEDERELGFRWEGELTPHWHHHNSSKQVSGAKGRRRRHGVRQLVGFMVATARLVVVMLGFAFSGGG